MVAPWMGGDTTKCPLRSSGEEGPSFRSLNSKNWQCKSRSRPLSRSSRPILQFMLFFHKFVRGNLTDSLQPQEKKAKASPRRNTSTPASLLNSSETGFVVYNGRPGRCVDRNAIDDQARQGRARLSWNQLPCARQEFRNPL